MPMTIDKELPRKGKRRGPKARGGCCSDWAERLSSPFGLAVLPMYRTAVMPDYRRVKWCRKRSGH